MKKLNFKIIENGLNEEKLNSFSGGALNSNMMDNVRGGEIPCDAVNPCSGGAEIDLPPCSGYCFWG